MPYCTLTDLVARAGEDEILQVADRDDDGVADVDVVTAAVSAADQRIDAALAVRFRLPLTSVPEIVQSWSVSIARYWLHRNIAPENVVKDYERALADLRDVVAGKLSVPDAEGLEPPQQTAIGATIAEGTAPAFDRTGLEGWL